MVPETDLHTEPPPLPRRLTDPLPVVLVGLAVWVVVLVVLGLPALMGSRPLGVWFWAAVIGIGLGVLGLGVLAWQRRANRRGSKGAQKLSGA